MLDANIYHVAAFIKKFLPDLLNRKDKTPFGLIAVSSDIGLCPAPNNAVYAATKVFVNYLTEGI